MSTAKVRFLPPKSQLCSVTHHSELRNILCFQPYFKELRQQFASRLGDANRVSKWLLVAFVETAFTFSHQPLRPTEVRGKCDASVQGEMREFNHPLFGLPQSSMQGNFAPVEEIGDIRDILEITGEIPADFPEGVYIRNGKALYFTLTFTEDHASGS